MSLMGLDEHGESLATIRKYATNELTYPANRPFAAILGESPSRGARSPVLWNAAFDALSLSCKMLPIDVREDRLKDILSALAGNSNFIGGAIAVPHKMGTAEWLGDAVTAESRAIGSVNCLYRNNSGQLMGTNTDGEAARIALIETAGSIKGKIILILGGGGAGLAVAAYMAKGVGLSGKVILAYRRGVPGATQQSALGIGCALPWNDMPAVLKSVDVVINCTIVGSNIDPDRSPLDRMQLSLLKEDAIVYDINYQPAQTRLIAMAAERGLCVLNGFRMNLEQAVKAFQYATANLHGQIDLVTIRSAMKAIH